MYRNNKYQGYDSINSYKIKKCTKQSKIIDKYILLCLYMITTDEYRVHCNIDFQQRVVLEDTYIIIKMVIDFSTLQQAVDLFALNKPNKCNFDRIKDYLNINNK